MFHERGGQFKDEFDFFLDYSSVVLYVIVLVFRVVVDQLDKHIHEFRRATPGLYEFSQ